MRTLTRFTSALLIALASFSYTANATLILEWNSNSFSTNTPATGASAKATLNFFDDMGLVRIDMVIRNTTGEIASFGNGATTSTLTGIAFDLLDPNSGVDSFIGGGKLDTMILDVALNGMLPTLEFAIADDSNFLGAGPGGPDGVSQGDEDTISVLIDFDGSTAAQVEAGFSAGFINGGLNYAARFQQVDGGSNNDASDKLFGGECCGNGGGGPPTEVPEPSVLFLLSSALLALSLRKKTY